MHPERYRFDIWSSFGQKTPFLMRVKSMVVHLVVSNSGWKSHLPMASTGPPPKNGTMGVRLRTYNWLYFERMATTQHHVRLKSLNLPSLAGSLVHGWCWDSGNQFPSPLPQEAITYWYHISLGEDMPPAPPHLLPPNLLQPIPCPADGPKRLRVSSSMRDRE